MQSSLLAPNANHLEKTIHYMRELGVGIWLCTDLKTTLHIDSEMGFAHSWANGEFGVDHNRASLFLLLNEPVNRLLGQLKEPVHLEAHGFGHVVARVTDQAKRIESAEELLVLNLIRDERVISVEVESPSGVVDLVKTKSRLEPTADLAQLLEEPYQRLTVVTKDGKTVLIEQEITTKPTKKGSK